MRAPGRIKPSFPGVAAQGVMEKRRPWLVSSTSWFWLQRPWQAPGNPWERPVQQAADSKTRVTKGPGIHVTKLFPLDLDEAADPDVWMPPNRGAEPSLPHGHKSETIAPAAETGFTRFAIPLSNDMLTFYHKTIRFLRPLVYPITGSTTAGLNFLVTRPDPKNPFLDDRKFSKHKW